MDIGLERVLAPSSVLIAIADYVEHADQEGISELACLLYLVSEFYGSAARAVAGRESEALVYALEKMRNGHLSG
jgi:hypothetical protein